MTPIKKVVIAGGGTAGWMAAASLSQLLKGSLEVSLVESDNIGIVGVGEATIPPIRTLHKLLNIDETAFVKATNATFKLGIQFENWGQQDDSYIHSFGMTGRECWAGEFHHFWLRGQREGLEYPFGAYCVEHQAALANKFGFSQQLPMNFAYHLDASQYGQFLRKMAEGNGVRRIEGTIHKVNKNPQTGFIEKLVLQNGKQVAGDFFIDCTGFRGLLIEQALHTGYEDWSHYLPCDSAVAVQTQSVEAPRPYTKAIAHDAGWQWQIPLQHRTGNGLVYCQRYLSDDAARDRLLSQIEGQTINAPRVIKFKPGKRRKGWNKNCVALGLASGFIEPLESTSIHLIMTAIVRLMRLFPFEGISQAAINEYNNKFNSEMQCILDFIVMHYKVTRRNDSPFWQHCQEMEIPCSLQHKLDLFKNTGLVFLDDGDIFRVDSWTQVMLGQGLQPKQFNRVAYEMSDEEFSRFMKGVREHVKAKINALPPHSNFIDKFVNQAAHKS